LSQDEIDYLKGNDMEEAERLARTLPYFDGLNDARQVVVCDMVFNLGFRKWASFVKANEALADHDYETAADEMVDSKWYRQTKRRAVKNVRIMRRGVWE
jgi:lysozyme